MKSNKSIKKNIIYQVIYDTLGMLIPFIISPYISRVIGAEGLGIYSFHYSIAFYFTLVAALGIKNYGNRAIAKCRENTEELGKTFSSLLLIQAIMSLICSVFYILYLLLLSNPSESVYATIMLLQVLSAFFDISWFYFGIENFRLTVFINSIIKAVTLVSVFTFVKTNDDIWIYCLIMSLGILIGQLALWVPLHKYVSFAKPSILEIRVHIKPLVVLFIPTIAVSLYKYMDKIMIGLMSNKTQLGYYENAEKVVSLPVTVIASFGTVMIPRMSNMVAKKEIQGTLRYTKISSLYVMWLSYALAFGFAAVSRVFAPVYWGNSFILSGEIIIGLAITIPFISFANIIRTQYLIPHEKDIDYVISVSGGAVINLVLNSLLIPYLGAIGATIATIAAEITVCMIQCLSVRHDLPLQELFGQTAPFLVLAAAMFIIIFIASTMVSINTINLIVLIFAGSLFYCAGSGAYLFITKEPTFLSLISRIKKRRV